MKLFNPKDFLRSSLIIGKCHLLSSQIFIAFTKLTVGMCSFVSSPADKKEKGRIFYKNGLKVLSRIIDFHFRPRVPAIIFIHSTIKSFSRQAQEEFLGI